MVNIDSILHTPCLPKLTTFIFARIKNFDEKHAKKNTGYWHFLLFQQYFQKFSSQGPKLFTTPSRLLTTLGKEPFETIVGKGENAGYQHFLLFPLCFQKAPYMGVVKS